MEITPDKTSIVGLVAKALAGEVCLPNFQRDFVWAPDDVADLLRSVLRSYFLGSLLLLRSDPDHPPFAPAYLRGVTDYAAGNGSALLQDATPSLLVLDGQQRLTSMLYALTAPNLGLRGARQARRFYINLDALRVDPDSEDIVVHYTTRDVHKEGLDNIETQFRRHHLPCTRLLTYKAFSEWSFALGDWLQTSSPDEYAQFVDDDRVAWNNIAVAFQGFDVAVVYLPQVRDDDEEAISQVCAIFEKLNSTGEELSVYDLLTARLFRSRINLHELWDSSIDQHSRLKAWSEGRADAHSFGVLVLRTLALLRDLETKPGALINLKPKGFEEDWRRAAAAMERALQLVETVDKDGFGVFDPKWLPGYGLLPVLAALRAEIDDRKLGEEPRRQLRRWYWCSVFLNRFSSAVDSKSRKDYREFLDHWLKDGPEPALLGEARARIGAPGYSVSDAASYASAIYSGVFCLLALRGARDWQFGETIQLHQLEDHHIFPQNYLKTHGYSGRGDKGAINSIVNRTLISATSNQRIKDKAPATYLNDKTLFPGEAEEALAPHFVDLAALTAMRNASEGLITDGTRAIYASFCSSRERVIVAAIRDMCGVPLDASSIDPSEGAID